MTTDISPQARQTLNILVKAHQGETGIQREWVRSTEALEQERMRIRASEYKGEKEQALLVDVAKRTAISVDEHLRNLEQEQQRTIEAKVKAIDVEVARQHEIPRKEMTDTDAAWAAKLHRYNIEQTRELQATVRANSDLLLVSVLTDPAELEAIAVEALQDGHVERLRVIGRAVEAKLRAQAIVETRRGAGGAKPAAEALARVGSQLQAWRTRESERSPAVRKQRLLAEHQAQVQARRNAAIALARQFGFHQYLPVSLQASYRPTGNL